MSKKTAEDRAAIKAELDRRIAEGEAKTQEAQAYIQQQIEIAMQNRRERPDEV